ncbi:MAG: GGDEF domain-containing protein [Clostridia bacterium]|nr:GGDEF domain-containing protein [Clostridia bacterium]
MISTKKSRRIRNRIILTVITVVFLFSIFVAVVNYSYGKAKQNGFENLHLQTKEVKEDLELQMVSDTENLQTMARFAAKLHSNGEDMNIMLKSFKSIGLIEEVGILLPDNSFITRAGTFPTVNGINFEEETKKVPYVSGVVNDVTLQDKKIVRSAVPIVSENGLTVGILYGRINIETLEKRLLENASTQGVQIFVVERGNGNFIINTIDSSFGNVSLLETRTFVEDYSFEDFRDMALAGVPGYTAFVSQIMKDTTLYLHHSPLTIGDWQIMLAEPEKNVFTDARNTGRTMAVMFSLIVVIMGAYLLLIFSGEQKEGKMNMCASKIRKILLGINTQEKGIRNALENVARFSSSRSAFFVDTDGDDYNYITPEAKASALSTEDRAYVISRLLNSAQKNHNEKGTNVILETIVADNSETEASREFYELLKKSKIKKIVFAGVVNRKNHVSVLGCINPKKASVAQLLLEDISVCFSMAIHNKKHLNKTEIVASTDSLTGLYNRMAYKTDLLKFDEKHSENFSCVYMDVNELHVINNKYGHATGDGMLLYIADSIRETFTESSVYRIGGDEFLVFTENVPKEEIEKKIAELTEKTEKMNYHISIGMDFSRYNTDTELLVNNAEKRMYEEKARYYQNKKYRTVKTESGMGIDRISTGIREFDALLSVLSNRYHGIYCVSLESGMARRILMPEYLNQFSQENDSFKDAFVYYVREMVHSDYQRAMLSFLNYDIIGKQLEEGRIPSIEYIKVNGEKVVLSVYGLPDKDKDNSETLWVFENMD